MASTPLEWRTNLRANLVLWPDVSPNITALVAFDSQPYNEDEFIKSFPAASKDTTKAPTDTRAVRNTFEALALSGLAFKDSADPPKFRLTDLGASLFSFLGIGSEKRFANENNRPVISDVLIRGLSIIVEYKAIWTLMRHTDDLLSNEELNRAMAQMRYLEDVPRVAKKVLDARLAADPAKIGPRIYEDEKYVESEKRQDQRKAINPLFLLSGGGKLFITMDDAEEYRRIEDWAVPLIDRRLDEPVPQVHASTDREIAHLISEYSAVQGKKWIEA
jgi:hypothetical protein